MDLLRPPAILCGGEEQRRVNHDRKQSETPDPLAEMVTHVATSGENFSVTARSAVGASGRMAR